MNQPRFHVEQVVKIVQPWSRDDPAWLLHEEGIITHIIPVNKSLFWLYILSLPQWTEEGR
jgi:hypothetical protein